MRGFHSFAAIIFVLALAQPFVDALQGVIVTWSNGPGQRLLVFTFQAEELRNILFAFLLLAVAHVFRHAYLLADEQAHFL